MEYLMTYGWALLVIVLVIAVLILINPFSAPQGCRFDQVGFTCNVPILASATGEPTTMNVRIANGNNNLVEVYKIVCTSVKGANAPEAPAQGRAPIKSIGRQEEWVVTDVKCVDEAGDAIIGMPVGSDFTGRIWLFYRNEEDPTTNYPYRVASAAISAKVSQSAS